jgi:hypothetical protein
MLLVFETIDGLESWQGTRFDKRVVDHGLNIAFITETSTWKYSRMV